MLRKNVVLIYHGNNAAIGIEASDNDSAVLDGMAAVLTIRRAATGLKTQAEHTKIVRKTAKLCAK